MAVLQAELLLLAAAAESLNGQLLLPDVIPRTRIKKKLQSQLKTGQAATTASLCWCHEAGPKGINMQHSSQALTAAVASCFWLWHPHLQQPSVPFAQNHKSPK